MADDAPLTLLEAELLTPAWTDADVAFVDVLAKRLGLPAEELLLPLASESKLNPRARNPIDPKGWPVAVGLFQMSRSAAQGMGLIPLNGPAKPEDGDAYAVSDPRPTFGPWKELADDFLRWSPMRQLQLFERYLAATNFTGQPGGIGKWDTAARIYQAVAASSTLNPYVVPTRDTVVYPAGSAGYAGNTALDLDGNGVITFGDLTDAVNAMRKEPAYRALLKRLRG